MIGIFDFERKPEENENQFIWRLCNAKDTGVIDITWPELAKYLNRGIYKDAEENYLGESAYRKRFQMAKNMYEDVFSKMESNEYSDDLMEKKRELERAKIAFRDERNAWQKQNYTDARVAQRLDYLEEELKSIGKNVFSVENNNVKSFSDNDLLVVLSDLHIGQTFNTTFGKYNTDIAAERLYKYLLEIKEIQKRHNSEECWVSIQGDLISGSIHNTLAITNRENVIDQIKIATEYISSFITELSKCFNIIHVTNVSGNHSRIIQKKEDSIHDERLDDLIFWSVKNLVGHLDNVDMLENAYDIGISEMNIRGKCYVGVHGDYDSFSKQGVGNLTMMIGKIPYAVIFGHLHTCTYDDVGGVRLIRGGSLGGCGDQYTIEKRLNGKPSQMVCVCSSEGIECCYPIEFS